MLTIEGIATEQKNARIFRLGGSPLLLTIIQRLGLIKLINETCPTKRTVSNGQAVMAFLLVRLLNPKALYKVERWLAASGLDAVLEHPAEKFNDDTLGRMMDDVEAAQEGLWLGLIGNALVAYPELAGRFVHYDVTSSYFEGAYEASELAKRGYSRDHRSDAKQVNIGLSVVGESGLPLLYELLAGNAADCTTPLAHFAKLKALLDKLHYDGKLVMVGDRAMFNRKLVGAYLTGGVQFLGPWTPPEVQKLVAGVESAELLAHPLAFEPQSAKVGEESTYYGVLRPLEFSHEQKTYPLKVLVLYSRGKAKLDRDRREDHVCHVEQGLLAIQGKLNQRRCRKKCYVEERIKRLFSASPDARGLLTYKVSGQDGHLKLTFTRNEEAITQAVSVEGRYALVSNADLSAEEMLTHFKQQCRVERRFSLLKGPLRVRPIHVRSDKRISAMVFLNMVALVIYTILEWVVRRQTPGRKRPWTARTILETFEELAVTTSVAENGCIQWLLPTFSPTQETLWQVFGLPALFEYVKLSLNRVTLWAT